MKEGVEDPVRHNEKLSHIIEGLESRKKHFEKHLLPPEDRVDAWKHEEPRRRSKDI